MYFNYRFVLQLFTPLNYYLHPHLSTISSSSINQTTTLILPHRKWHWITQFHSTTDLSMDPGWLLRAPRPARTWDSAPSTWMRSADNGIPDGSASSSSPAGCGGPTWAACSCMPGQDVWLWITQRLVIPSSICPPFPTHQEYKACG